MNHRGRRLSSAAKRADLVLVDARLSSDGHRLAAARGFERRGEVWSDLLILDRDTVVRRLKDGKAVFTGRPTELPGDFELLARVRLNEGSEAICAGSAAGAGASDHLGLPIS
ncbi:MAG TPA: hypothetical protein VJJ46_08630 [Anaerolineales bacterium]|nr:hypothetical protein [Anaerolineales bacterium]